MHQIEANYLVKLLDEEKPRPATSLRTVEHPTYAVWIEVTQCSGDVLLVDKSRISYILIKNPTIKPEERRAAPQPTTPASHPPDQRDRRT